jgi:2'-5' RNA ligase
MGMRTFIAVEASPPLREELFSLQQELRKSSSDVKWVEPQNIHLTLKFLGDTKEEKIPEIKEALSGICLNANPFKIGFCGIGVFPKPDSPRVVWIGIKEGEKQITELAACIENDLSRLGFEPEKRTFSAHLTLGRVRSEKNKNNLKNAIAEIASYNFKNTLIIENIVLFRSELDSAGPRYTKLAEFGLSNIQGKAGTPTLPSL